MTPPTSVPKILFLFLLLVSAGLADADQIVGEIINVNQEYKTAYTDLDNTQLAKGDIVEVFKNGEHISYLEIKDTTMAMTQLGPVDKNRGLKTVEDFSRITIGSNVIKYESGQKSTEAARIKPDKNFKKILKEKEEKIKVSEKEKIAIAENYEVLKKDLVASEIKIQELKNENQQLSEEIEALKRIRENDRSQEEIKRLKNALNQLKKKLIKMEQSIEGQKS